MFSFNKSFAALVLSTASASVPMMATAQSCGGGWTFIDPGNEAKITTFVGLPTQGGVCVQFVDAETRQAACTQLWRNAEPGGKKELDTHCGSRTLDTKGALYEVFVRNTTGRPICASSCGLSIGGITFAPPVLAGPQLPEGIRVPDGVVPDEALLAAVLVYPEAVRLLPGFNDWFSSQLEQAREDAGKGLRHLAEETERARENTEEAVRAYGNFVENQANGAGDLFDETTQRIREGKLLDAFWHASIGPLKNTEQSSLTATQESSLIRTAAALAASTSGGPAGAAAFASWYTYRTTGDAELALRVGLIAGGTSLAMSEISQIPDDQLTQKAAMAGAVAGLGVAATGGDNQAIQEAFIRGAGMILVQDGYRRAVNRADVEPDDQLRIDRERLGPPSSEVSAYCMDTQVATSTCAPDPGALIRNENDDVVDIDWQKADPDASHVGIFTKSPEEVERLLGQLRDTVAGETGPVMTTIADLPGMNAMSLFHDRWAIVWDMNDVASIATIPPSIVLVYLGTEAPLQNMILETAAENAADDQGNTPILSPSETSAAPLLQANEEYEVPVEQRNVLRVLGSNLALDRYHCIPDSREAGVHEFVLNGPAESRSIVCSALEVLDNKVLRSWHAHHESGYCAQAVRKAIRRSLMNGDRCFQLAEPIVEQ